MTRPYTRLPDSETFLAVFHANAEQVPPTAAALGCSEAAVRSRLRVLGIAHPRTTWKSRVDKMAHTIAQTAVAAAAAQATADDALTRIGELELRVHRLEQQRIPVVVPVTHRRKADGGVGGRRERAILTASAARASVPTARAPVGDHGGPHSP